MLALLQVVTQQPEVWWQHMLEIIIGGSGPTIFVILRNRSNAKRQAEEQAAKDAEERKAQQRQIREELDKKHKENTERMNSQDDKLNEILNERKYIPMHLHTEVTGPLTAEGIFPKPRH